MNRVKKISKRAMLAASAGVFALCAGSAAVAQEATTGHAAAGPVTVDELVVTVQKREETLLKVPQSVSVVTEDTLQKQQAFNFQDYMKLVPGLNLQSATTGVTQLSLRGINTGGGGATVGIYVDDAPFGSSTSLANGGVLAGDFDTFDVARLEVLRGPQGTLYGASSLAGVVKFVTNQPTHFYEEKAQASIGSVAGGGVDYSGSAVINVPVNDKLAVRASGFYRFQDGFVSSIGNNPIPNLLGGPNIFDGSLVEKNFNSNQSYGGRVSALLTPTNNFSLRLTAVLQNLTSNGSNYYEGDPITYEPLYGQMTQSRYLRQPVDFKYRVYSATADWDLPWASLTSATSYSNMTEQVESDATLIQLIPGVNFAQLVTLLNRSGLLGAPTTTPLSVSGRQTTFTDKFTQEVRLASHGNDRFEWLVGGFYTRENSAVNPQDYDVVDATTGQPLAGFAPLIHVFLTSHYEEYAGFANATVHFTPKLDLTFGGRYGHNSQSADQFIDQSALAAIGGGISSSTASSSEGVFTYSVAPRYQLTGNTSIYARIASGYRPGGPNVLPAGAPPGTPLTYKSDRLTDYEVGIKGSWFNNMVSLDAAAYDLQWRDIQLFEVINNTGVEANGGTATSRGLEATAALRPVRGLTLGANAAYIDAYLTEDTDPVVGGLDGDPLPYVPKFAGSLTADYEWPVMNDATAFVGATLRYTGHRTVAFALRDASGEIVREPAYTTFDLRAGINTDHWSIAAYAHNLTNTGGITSNTSGVGYYPNGAVGVAVIRPRTLGVTVGAKF